MFDKILVSGIMVGTMKLPPNNRKAFPKNQFENELTYTTEVEQISFLLCIYILHNNESLFVFFSTCLYSVYNMRN